MLCCEKLRINGIVTHELGCTESFRGTKKNCKVCGNLFEVEERFQVVCDHSCLVVYNGVICDCSKCVEDFGYLNERE